MNLVKTLFCSAVPTSFHSQMLVPKSYTVKLEALRKGQMLPTTTNITNKFYEYFCGKMYKCWSKKNCAKFEVFDWQILSLQFFRFRSFRSDLIYKGEINLPHKARKRRNTKVHLSHKDVFDWPSFNQTNISNNDNNNNNNNNRTTPR